MKRKNSEDCITERGKDNNRSAPVTLELIESKVQLTSVKDMLVFESGRSDYRRISDIDLCKETDRKIREDLKKPSIYALTHEEKLKIAKYLKERFYAGTSQLNRCLSLHL